MSIPKSQIGGVPVYHEETWVYAGRVFYKRALYQRFFRDQGKGEESIFKRTKATVVGGLYKVQVDQGGSVQARMRYDGLSGHPLTQTWMSQDVQARGVKLIGDKEKRAGKEVTGTWTLKEMNRAYLFARGQERPALIAFIVAYVMNEV